VGVSRCAGGLCSMDCGSGGSRTCEGQVCCTAASCDLVNVDNLGSAGGGC
jgi:hypothetical protein